MTHSKENKLNSCIYTGQVRHRRFAPKKHEFNSRLYMLALDLDEVETKQCQTGLFGFNWYNPIRFVEKDYFRSEPGCLKQRIENKVKCLGGDWQGDRVMMLVQARCFGMYFSPANFFFCYQKDETGNEVCRYMVAEVSNTPWNERHYYLIDLQGSLISEKAFQVSPFMDLAMQYHWRVKPPRRDKNSLLVHIENTPELTNSGASKQANKFFDATLALKKVALTQSSLLKVWLSLPIMTLQIVLGIYYQAMKLFIKRIPFIGYQTKQCESATGDHK